MERARLREFVILFALIGGSACQHIGPGTIMDDRIPYNDAIATSWKQQTLLNIVRLRYMDTPEFVDVPSVVSGYEHGRTTSGGLIGSEVYLHDPGTFLSPALHASRSVVDRPTITYTPQTGSEFTRNLTHPIPPVSVLNLIESGNPADVVMELAVESINGLRNRGYAGSLEEGDPQFQQVVQIIAQALASGVVSLRATSAADSDNVQLQFSLRDRDVNLAVAKDLQELRRLLQLDPEVSQFKIVFGTVPERHDEIAIRTRSVLRILTFLSLYVQVPEEHFADGRAPDLGDTHSTTQPQLSVVSGCEPPCDAFAAVRYQGYWFWIDQRDFHSKRTMLYLKILLALADTQRKEAAPALTIRAN